MNDAVAIVLFRFDVRYTSIECNKRGGVVLINTAYCAPCLSLRVCRTLTLFLKVCRLVKHFSRENVARFAELRHVGKNRGAFGKKRHNMLPAQIQRQTIKVRYFVLSKSSTQICNQCCVLFDVYRT